MPIEALIFRRRKQPYERCPQCNAEPFRCFMRGQVWSWWRALLRKPPWAVICSDCHDIVDWEPRWRRSDWEEGPA